ncbi:hypothetical protein Tco_0860146 [Tanacetum coccineum]|uniref:Reverse transcriptase domain-containing protein n=1 Tax=Tanacetum coccineum TaxID=301880 RepID=A0ABQ5BJR4_9ASTR
MRNNSKIALARFRIANLEQIIEDIQKECDTFLLLVVLNVDIIPPKKDNNIKCISHDSRLPSETICLISVITPPPALKHNPLNMENTDNTTKPREAPIARQCSYKEFMSCQPINFKGTEGAVGLIRWFERTELVFSHSNCIEDCKVKFSTGTLTEEALSWWNSFAQPIGIEEAYNIIIYNSRSFLIKK